VLSTQSPRPALLILDTRFMFATIFCKDHAKPKPVGGRTEMQASAEFSLRRDWL
jgi:hypothetical protein